MRIRKNPSPADVRRFVCAWMLGAAAAGVLFFFRGHAVMARFFWTVGMGVGLCGLSMPAFGRIFYRVWMGLAVSIEFLVSSLLLTVVFWAVLTPMAILMKVFGRDALKIKAAARDRPSYWREHEKITDKASYRHLY